MHKWSYFCWYTFYDSKGPLLCLVEVIFIFSLRLTPGTVLPVSFIRKDIFNNLSKS
jgi:hypothetical protein